MITVLCIDKKSNYKKIEGLDLWDIDRNAWNYKGENKIIAHPPCQQWSRLRKFAKENLQEKELGVYCMELVQKNGGILEHPMGSELFKYMGVDRKKIFSINQSWWGFKAKKTTYLYVNQVELLPMPLNFNAIEKKVERMGQRARSIMPLELCQYLVNCIKQTK